MTAAGSHAAPAWRRLLFDAFRCTTATESGSECAMEEGHDRSGAKLFALFSKIE